MEKRVFSLFGAQERNWSIGYGVLSCLYAGFGLRIFWHDRSLRYAWMAMLIAMVVANVLRYVYCRSRQLEVSDQGLVMRSWLRKPVSIDWDAVTSVNRGYQVVSFRLYKHYLSAVVKDVAGHRIAIPGTSANSHEIIDILKQRLPESVFETR